MITKDRRLLHAKILRDHEAQTCVGGVVGLAGLGPRERFMITISVHRIGPYSQSEHGNRDLAHPSARRVRGRADDSVVPVRAEATARAYRSGRESGALRTAAAPTESVRDAQWSRPQQFAHPPSPDPPPACSADDALGV